MDPSGEFLVLEQWEDVEMCDESVLIPLQKPRLWSDESGQILLITTHNLCSNHSLTTKDSPAGS